jgi:alpha-tubulin suppressor-like RCC1 family protein
LFGAATLTLQVTSAGLAGSADLSLAVRAAFPVATGFWYSCALTTSNEAYCWGDNPSGGLGDGTINPRLTPGIVSGGQTFIQISAGDEHTCALVEDGRVFCWGFGALVPTVVGGGHSFIQMTAGKAHTCALTTDLEAFCWGDNTLGQLGTGSGNAATPVAVAGEHRFTALAAGRQHTCGIDEAQNAWCWGANGKGQLGDGGTTDRSQPIQVTGSHAFVRIDGGWDTTCAVDADGDGWCWGSNTDGELGNGVQSDDATSDPTQVVGGHSFTHMSTNTLRSCGITSDDRALCWGNNGGGYLGVGHANHPVLQPTEVTGLHAFVAIDLGRAHLCAVEASAALYCWGQNGAGQLGDGTQANRTEPIAVTVP